MTKAQDKQLGRWIIMHLSVKDTAPKHRDAMSGSLRDIWHHADGFEKGELRGM